MTLFIFSIIITEKKPRRNTMPLSMKKLMEATGESKSTILFYMKEGLLPEPEKPKPNVHKYDESCVNIIKLIKHLQTNFSYSISEIKSVFNKNDLKFDDSFEILINSLNMISGSKDEVWYSKEELLELTEITEQKLIRYKRKEFIFEREKGYSNKEVEMINVLLRAEDFGMDMKLIESYVKKAKELAELEFEIGAKLLLSDTSKHNSHYELLFDIVLSLKPYLFNMQTVNMHQEKIGETK